MTIDYLSFHLHILSFASLLSRGLSAWPLVQSNLLGFSRLFLLHQTFTSAEVFHCYRPLWPLNLVDSHKNMNTTPLSQYACLFQSLQIAHPYFFLTI